MRKFLRTLGAIAFAAILVTAIGTGIFIYNARTLDVESKAFIDSAIPAIAATWSKQQFLDRAAPELRDRIKLDELNQLFEQFSKLGPLVKYQGATGEANISYVFGTGGVVSAFYIGKANCENGDVAFRIRLLKRDRLWMITDFRVDSIPGSHVRRGA